MGGLREAPGLEPSLEPSRPGRPWEPGGGEPSYPKGQSPSRVPVVLCPIF